MDEGLLAIGAAVGVMWGLAIAVRGGLMAGCLTALLAGCCFGPPLLSLPMSPLPLTIDRALLAALLVQYACYRRLGLADPKPLRRADWVLVAFLGVLLLSTLTHDWQARNNQPLAWTMFLYLMPAALYWVARQTRHSERGLLALNGFLALLGVYLALTALAETRQLNSLVFPRYIVSPTFAEFLGRGRGPFLNPVGNGIFMSACLGALLMWWPRVGRLGQLLLLSGALIICAGAYCTLTRSVWIGAGLGLLLLIGLVLPRAWRGAVLGTAVVAGLSVAAVNWQSIVMLKRDKALDAEASADSAKLRPILATVAWHMFLDRPLLGSGYGQYPMESRPYFSDRSTDLPLEKARPYVQHNVFLALLVDTGAVGVSLFVLVLSYWTRDAWRLWTSGTASLAARQHGLIVLLLLVAYGVNGLLHDVSLIVMVHMLLFFMAGVSRGLLASDAVTNESTKSVRHADAPDKEIRALVTA